MYVSMCACLYLLVCACSKEMLALMSIIVYKMWTDARTSTFVFACRCVLRHSADIGCVMACCAVLIVVGFAVLCVYWFESEIGCRKRRV
jgi:hypothetical protein